MQAFQAAAARRTTSSIFSGTNSHVCCSGVLLCPVAVASILPPCRGGIHSFRSSCGALCARLGARFLRWAGLNSVWFGGDGCRTAKMEGNGHDVEMPGTLLWPLVLLRLIPGVDRGRHFGYGVWLPYLDPSDHAGLGREMRIL